MANWAMVVDITKCNGCYNCFIACKDEFWDNEYPPYSSAQPRHGHFWMQVFTRERGQFPHVRVAYMPVPCMHCDNAPCIDRAKNGAIYKRLDGIIIIDPAKSFGQKQLVEACPYGVIFWNEERRIPQKCTFCAHLLDKGWKEPRCVQACPTGALIFGDLDDPKSTVYKVVTSGKAERFKPELGTNPRVYYIGLYRFTKEFIAGSVVLKDTDECAEKVKVTLHSKEDDSIQVALTNEFGDFEFDGLNPGEYHLSFEYPGYQVQKMDVKLQKSVHLGYIFLEKQ